MTKLKSIELIDLLRRNPRSGSFELCARLGGINRATLTRALKTLGPDVLCGGGSRRTRYAWRRALRGISSSIPLFRIDENGAGHEIGHLSLTYPEGTFLDYQAAFSWPLDQDMTDGWFDSLPYPLLDQRPQGFLGRNFAHAHALDLGVSENPETWSDDDITFVLSTIGYDQPGDLILGESAYRKFLDRLKKAGDRFLPEDKIEVEYLLLADIAMAHGDAGSSAGGEFPKFTSSRVQDSRHFDVIVKFSGPDNSAAVRRWSDLLVCEHLASMVIQGHLQIDAARSTIYQFGGRTFLEVERFDRHGDSGRSPVCTLSSLNAALVGVAGVSWPKLGDELHRAGWLNMEDVERIRRVWWFGKLIANSDMHEGNLAFRPGLVVAPTYDMLPMAYAPMRGGELPNRQFEPELPLPSEKASWQSAAMAAIQFWQICSDDDRISLEFRGTCHRNRRYLLELCQKLG